MADDKIHVALAVYDPRGTYSRHAGVVLVSMFSNTKSPVCVHILHDETLGGDNREKFIALAEKFGQELNFVNVGEHIGKLRIDADKLTGGFSRGAIYRLLIQDVLSIDRVIYLDCDVIVELDIKELWDTDISDCKIGVVIDDVTPSQRRSFFFRYTGIDVKKYFSSGVLLFNLKNIRDNVDVCSEASEFFLRYPDTLFADQDFYNKIFQESMCEIDRKFNYYGRGIDYSNMEGKLWHLARRKPWELATDSPTDALYWRYFAMTPWCGDLTTDIIKSLAGSRYIHIHSSDCYKTLWQKRKEIFSPRNITPFYKALVIWHDITYRIRKRLFHR